MWNEDNFSLDYSKLSNDDLLDPQMQQILAINQRYLENAQQNLKLQSIPNIELASKIEEAESFLDGLGTLVWCLVIIGAISFGLFWYYYVLPKRDR